MRKFNFNNLICKSWLKPMKRFFYPSLKAGVIITKILNFLSHSLQKIKKIYNPSIYKEVIISKIHYFLLQSLKKTEKNYNPSIYAGVDAKKTWALALNKKLLLMYIVRSVCNPRWKIGIIGLFVFSIACNSNEKVELTKDEKAEAHNTVLNRTPKLLDSLDKECARNFISNRQHFIDSLLKVRLEKIQAKVSSNTIQQ